MMPSEYMRNVMVITNQFLPTWKEIFESCNDSNQLQAPFGRSIHLVDNKYVCKITNGKVDEEEYSYVPRHAYPIVNELYERDFNEVTILCQIQDIAPVPKIYHYTKGLIIQEYIEGDTLEYLWPQLSNSEKQKIKASVARVMKRLSILNISTVPIKLDERYDKAFEGELLFLHSDLNLSNIIVKDGQLKGIIDWEYAGHFNIETISAINKDMCERGKAMQLGIWADLYDIIPTIPFHSDKHQKYD